MTGLSPEAVEAHELLAGLTPLEMDQYAGLTPLERVAAATHPHISMCRLGDTRMDCITCADELHRIRAYIAAVQPVIEAEALERAYWKIREHGEAYRGTDSYRRHVEAWRRDPDNPVLSRAAVRDRWYASGIEAAAGDVAELIPGEECDLERPAPRHAAPDDGIGDDGAPVAAAVDQEGAQR